MNRYNCVYFVEGESEENLVETLKKQDMIIVGKVHKINVTQKQIKTSKIRTIRQNSIVVFVFDVDRGGKDKLIQNVNAISKYCKPKDIVLITQVNNLEDELVRSCNIKRAEEFFNSRNLKEFKKNFKNSRNLYLELDKKGFDFTKMWVTKPKNEFSDIDNNGIKIKIDK